MLRLSMMVAARQRLSEGLASHLASVNTDALSVLRLVLYLIVTVAAFGTIVMAAVGSPNPAALFEDNGPWEWVEFFLLVASGAICFVNARRNEIYTHILKLCGLRHRHFRPPIVPTGDGGRGEQCHCRISFFRVCMRLRG